MNKYLFLLAVILSASLMTLSTSAQETQTVQKGRLSFGIGMNFFGPRNQMADLMVEYDFDRPSSNWLFGGKTEHPNYAKVGFTGFIAYSRYFTSKSQIGLLLNYASLSEVDGNSYTAGALNVRFSNVSLIPLYTFELAKYLELMAGPALMINSGNKTSWAVKLTDDYTKLSAGVLTGLNLKIWDRKVNTGNLSLYYLFSTANKMGPYTAENGVNTSAIPESKFRFNYLNLIFVLGFKQP